MLTSFSVENYRNLKSIRLEGLGRLTLIGGRNGAGKTALLEALWLLSGPDIPELSTRVSGFRGLPILGPENVFHDIFHDFNPEKRIRLRAYGDWGSLPRTLEIRLQSRESITTTRSDSLERSNLERLTRLQDEGEFEIVFMYRHSNNKKYTSRAWWVAEQLTPDGIGSVPAVVNEGIRQERQSVLKRATSVFMAAVLRENLQTTASRLGKLQLQGEDAKVLEFIRPLEPRLRGLAAITIKDTPVIHAYMDGMSRPIPVQLLGEGLNRMLLLALSMSEATGGLLLVDEIENGLHHSVQEEVFSILASLANSFDVQIFATTHSDECVRAAQRALAGRGPQEFVFYRLDHDDEEVKAVGFDSEMLETAIEFNMEIR